MEPLSRPADFISIGSAKERPMEKPKDHAQQERERIEWEEDEVVVSSDESFPASDPPSFNPGITGTEDIKKKKGR
jgi:hypothetical protein